MALITELEIRRDHINEDPPNACFQLMRLISSVGSLVVAALVVLITIITVYSLNNAAQLAACEGSLIDW